MTEPQLKKHLKKREQLAEDVKYFLEELNKHQLKVSGANLFAGGNFGVVAVKYLDELWKGKR
jgi:hypothetical protein